MCFHVNECLKTKCLSYFLYFSYILEWCYKTNGSQENANLIFVFEYKRRRGILDWLWSWSFYMHSSHIKHSFTHKVWHFNILRKYHHFISCWLWMWFTNTFRSIEHQTSISLFHFCHRNMRRKCRYKGIAKINTLWHLCINAQFIIFFSDFFRYGSYINNIKNIEII